MADAEKQKRWSRALFMNGFAVGYSMCLKLRAQVSDDMAMDLAGQECHDTYERWDITMDELRAAQAYAVELHNEDGPKKNIDG